MRWPGSENLIAFDKVGQPFARLVGADRRQLWLGAQSMLMSRPSATPRPLARRRGTGRPGRRYPPQLDRTLLDLEMSEYR
jgi:hypothetical protein